MVQMKGFDSAKPKLKVSPTSSSASTNIPSSASEGPKNFGVKSYLHQFYQQPTQAELEQSGWYLLPASPRNQRSLQLCRACSIIGLLLLLLGAAGVVLGYTWPVQPVESKLRAYFFGDDNGDYFKVPEAELAALFTDDPMWVWKLVGLSLFTLGGALLALSLLIPTLMASCASDEEHSADLIGDQPIRVFPAQMIAETDPAETPKTSMETSKVQPENDNDGQSRQAADEPKKKRKVSEDEMLMNEGEPIASSE